MVDMPASAPPRMPTLLRFTLALLSLLLLAVLAMYVFNPLGTASLDPRLRVLGHAPFRVVSSSMLPTLADGDQVVVSALSLRHTPLAAGDLLVFFPPNAQRSPYLQRLIGLPGDRVRIEDGKTYVNDQLLQEPYLGDQVFGRRESLNVAEVIVPADGLWLLGDSRDNSYDSRHWGHAQRDQVVGRVVWSSQ